MIDLISCGSVEEEGKRTAPYLMIRGEVLVHWDSFARSLVEDLSLTSMADSLGSLRRVFLPRRCGEIRLAECGIHFCFIGKRFMEGKINYAFCKI